MIDARATNKDLLSVSGFKDFLNENFAHYYMQVVEASLAPAIRATVARIDAMEKELNEKIDAVRSMVCDLAGRVDELASRERTIFSGPFGRRARGRSR
eukprot:7382978-Lingulodinium_polyedra.AAC.1